VAACKEVKPPSVGFTPNGDFCNIPPKKVPSVDFATDMKIETSVIRKCGTWPDLVGRFRSA
jgi:hypothetical protein